MSYDEKLKFVSVVATPMASRKFSKKIYKLIKKSSKQKDQLRSGLKVLLRFMEFYRYEFG
jgi:H/ACA ribonucleoprotein complex subunit 2